MSRKIILNDNEVVTNEDVASAQDLRARDLNRVLEGLLLSSLGAGPAASIEGGAIVSGLNLTRSSSTLAVGISTGTALMAFGGSSVEFDNVYQLSSLENPISLGIPAAPVVGQTRYDVIECSAVQITETEERNVLTSLGPTRRLVPTIVPKTIRNTLLVRVRPGAAAVSSSALIPSLRPDPAWIPLYVVGVSGGSLTTSSLIIHDVRRWVSRVNSHGLLSSAIGGFRTSPHVYLAPSSNTIMTVSPNEVSIAGYTSLLGNSSFSPTLTAPLSIDVSFRIPNGVTRVVDQWFYLYAVRPNSSCGNVILTYTPDPPPTGANLPVGTRTNLPLPAPWPNDPTSVGQYLGAFRLYLDGGSFYVRDFLQVGNYVTLATILDGVNPPGANSSSSFVSIPSLADATNQLVTINPGVSGDPVVPPHTRMVRTHWSFNNSLATGYTVSFITQAGLVFASRSFPSGRNYIELDIPLPSDGSQEFTVRVNTSPAGSVTSVDGFALGYYEGSV